ncbi:MAG: DUF72 domain-containing protein [Thermofilaceae archaeon]|nr:DUF72 domain-containing protein [Thermofilaceae archaeon]
MHLESLDEFLLDRPTSRIRIGTSGWDYDDWIGPFYESERGMLSTYMKFFNTVEVNSSFYALHSEKFFESLARAAPPSFLYSVKAYKAVTHKKLLNPRAAEPEIQAFFKSIRPLVEYRKLGAVLVQLPPKGRREIPWLESFLAELPRGVRTAVEFRDTSWLDKEVFKTLERYNVAYVIVDEPLLPPVLEVTASFSYVRWHGRGERPWYYYHYSLEELKPWAEKLKQLTEQVELILGYFNNHFRGFAPHNALQMLALLGLADGRRERMLAKMEEHIATPHVGESLMRDLEAGEIERALRILAGERRFHRGLEISDGEVSYNFSERKVFARVKSYVVEVDLAEKRLYHDCEDWRKSVESKRFCKHLVKLFTMLPVETSKEVLSNIVTNLEDWEFSSPS